MIWNPAPHIQHAWLDAKTVWGKIGLFLFYSLVWFNIISAAWAIVWPYSQGLGCIIEQAGTDTGKDLMASMMRATNVFALGFYSYADVGGLKVKNVAMVAIITTAFFLAFWPITTIAHNGGCACALAQMMVFPTWAIVALVFASLEDKLGDHGTTEESQNLI